MSDLREQIRSLLREELAALRASAVPAPHTVRIDSDSDLLQFVRTVLARAQDPAFVADVNAGRVRFALEPKAPQAWGGTSPGTRSEFFPSAPVREHHPCLDKTLLTEKDLAAVVQGQRVLRVGQHCRVTPLAKDEARRRGIRIERSAA